MPGKEDEGRRERERMSAWLLKGRTREINFSVIYTEGKKGLKPGRIKNYHWPKKMDDLTQKTDE